LSQQTKSPASQGAGVFVCADKNRPFKLNLQSSCADLIRASTSLLPLNKVMDHRVKPGGDDSELFFEVATQLKSLNRTAVGQTR
jgi:hypothetical protein